LAAAPRGGLAAREAVDGTRRTDGIADLIAHRARVVLRRLLQTAHLAAVWTTGCGHPCRVPCWSIASTRAEDRQPRTAAHPSIYPPADLSRPNFFKRARL